MQNIKKIGDIEHTPWMIWDGRTQKQPKNRSKFKVLLFKKGFRVIISLHKFVQFVIRDMLV